jgi:hypothetical protein
MRPVSLRLLAIGTLALAASCDSGVTAPPPAASGTSAERLILAAPKQIAVVERTTPLAAPLTASATIGILGGQISIPGAGLKVVIPPFALTSAKKITVTALAGSQVAYEFEPHGTNFLVPLLITQNLTGTNAVGGLLTSNLKGAYFAQTSDLDPLNGTALVSELLSVALNLSTKTATFPVFHFSGYLIASGECSDPFDSSH